MFAALALAPAGCGGGGGGGGGGFAPPQAAPAQNIQTFAEAEPNDAPNQAQDLGQISPGDFFQGTGTVTFNDQVGDDEFDSFQVTATSAQTLTVTLLHDAGVDLDLAFVDPSNGNILTELCDGPTAPEICTFALTAGQRVNIEVESFQGQGSYTIAIVSNGN